MKPLQEREERNIIEMQKEIIKILNLAKDFI
jgi:hypothetical protein